MTSASTIAAQQAFGMTVTSGALELDDLVADGHGRGVRSPPHQNPRQPVLWVTQPPLERAVEVPGVRISTIVGGKLVERWGSSDQLGISTQIGVIDPA